MGKTGLLYKRIYLKMQYSEVCHIHRKQTCGSSPIAPAARLNKVSDCIERMLRLCFLNFPNAICSSCLNVSKNPHCKWHLFGNIRLSDKNKDSGEEERDISQGIHGEIREYRQVGTENYTYHCPGTTLWCWIVSPFISSEISSALLKLDLREKEERRKSAGIFLWLYSNT